MIHTPFTVVVALSGGVDSALSAALLQEQGWQVQGLHWIMPAPPAKCEAKKNLVMRIAEHLAIPVVFQDVEMEFTQQVITPFTEAYLKGLTPNPCIICNQAIKFDHLVKYADEHGISHVATGHYAKVHQEEGGLYALLRGKDRAKEQSYFLHRLTQAHLRRVKLPLGGLTKTESRALARERNLPSKEEPESQEICFIPENDYRRFVEGRKGLNISRKGGIWNSRGEKVGEHLGTYRYTIGQRHGLGIASSRPYYVMALKPEENLVVVGRKEELYSREVEADAFTWIEGRPPEMPARVSAQIRYRHRPAPGRVEVVSGKKVRFVFDEPQWAITPGQALVCYGEERVLGGGWIRKG